MPVHNDPKAPRRHRTADRVRALRTAAANALMPHDDRRTEGAKGVKDVYAGAFSHQQLADLDTLWNLGNYQKIVDQLTEHAARLEGKDFAGLDPEALYQLSTQLFVLEQRIGTLLNRVTLVDAKQTVLKALTTQKKLAAAQTAVFRRAVELQDASSTTPVGQWIVFRDTQKKPGFHSPDAQEQYYVDKVRKFIGAGGDPTQIKDLDAAFLGSLKSGELVEYVVDALDVPRAAVVAEGKPSPGHTLLARGGDALSAGTLAVTKNARGEITQVIVGTFSGHFRSGLEAQQHLVRHLVAAGVPLERIVQREGQAGNPRTQEILGRVLGIDGAEAQRRETALIADAFRWDPLTSSPVFPAVAGDHSIGPKRPHTVAAEPHKGLAKIALNDALAAMRLEVSRAIDDGVILSDQPSTGGASEVQKVTSSIGDVLMLAQQAGNPLAYGQALALLRHLAALPAVNLDEVGRKELGTLLARWQPHKFGETTTLPGGVDSIVSGFFDPAEVFGPHPARDRRARICATINPKATEAQLREMIGAGMDIARFNTAHGTVDEQVALMARIRKAAAALGKNVTIQVDLEGPKIRLGKFENPKQAEFNDILLPDGAVVTLTTKDVLGTPTLLPVDYPTLCDDVHVGDPIFMNDGTVELVVKSVDVANGTLSAEVVTGGKVWDKKGINLPRSTLSVRTITDEDLFNLKALLPHVDLVASSFVRDAYDIEFLRDRMKSMGRTVPIIAKIERPEGLANLEQIAIVSDALMVARGDLGVEIGYENVPAAERRINAVGKLYGKATMVATEVLMSMVKDPSRPSRGDVEGLYAAIYDRGADAIMLGKETSFPSHPAEVIRAASRVIEKAEEERRNGPYKTELDVIGQGGVMSVRDMQRGLRPSATDGEPQGDV